MTEPEEIKLVANRLREMTSTLSELSNIVLRIRHTNDYVVTKTEKLDSAIEQIRKASDSLQSAMIELMAAGYRL